MLAVTGPVARSQDIICGFPEAGALCMRVKGEQGKVLSDKPARIRLIAASGKYTMDGGKLMLQPTVGQHLELQQQASRRCGSDLKIDPGGLPSAGEGKMRRVRAQDAPAIPRRHLEPQRRRQRTGLHGPRAQDARIQPPRPDRQDAGAIQRWIFSESEAPRWW